MSVYAIGGIEALAAQAPPSSPLHTPAPVPPTAGGSFAHLLVDGVNGVNDKLLQADAAVKAFAIDDSVPLHQVTLALEQARLSFELMLQVRAKLVEGYQEIMRMQL